LEFRPTERWLQRRMVNSPGIAGREEKSREGMKRKNAIVLFVLVLGLCLGACKGQAEVDLQATLQQSATPTPISTPTPEPPPPSMLVVCLQDEPQSLYLYGASGREADVVLQALYDGPFDVRGFAVQPVILSKIPSLADGDARLESVSITEGSTYLNPETLQPDVLKSGMPYLKAGCRGEDCISTYYSGEVFTDRMVVDFQLREGVSWSDGQPVTAGDSVFSYQLDASPDTPSVKYLVDRTASYEVVDDRTVRWTGIAGFLDTEYQTNFWTPLPRHQLGAYSAAELLTLEEAAKNPLGWGAFVMQSWQPGEQIVMQRNESYFRSDEGLPGYDMLVFRFLGDVEAESALLQVVSGECDLVDETLLDGDRLVGLAEDAQAEQVRLEWAPGLLLERVEFNLLPTGGNIGKILTEVRTRQAIAQCIDRQGLVDEVLAGMGEVSDSYIPATHPLYAGPSDTLTYDPSAAQAMLQSIGWVRLESAADGIRTALSVNGVRQGTPLVIRYLSPPGALHEAIAQHLEQDLAQCGVQLQVEAIAQEQLFAEWPDGEAFGRKYGMLEWAWPTWLTPACEVFSSAAIASNDNPHGYNASGYRDRNFDQACLRVLQGPSEDEAFLSAVERTQELFATNLPAVPLFVLPRLVAVGRQVCGIEVDPSALSILWNVESLYEDEACAE
jgi:peptide/nickel transport system substrate-binding protein